MADPFTLPPDLAARISRAERAVSFTGAGISAESGLATFRDPGGLWERFRPEDLATPEAFARRPAVVWSWYAARFRQAAAARPNPGHFALARLATLFPFFTTVTQNVDGLHARAGSRDVLELHGTLCRARCVRCSREVEMAEATALSDTAPPPCACGGHLRPAVVWFGEALPEETFARAVDAAGSCDLFVVAGTSATVFPAAGLIDVARRGGAAVVEVNPEATAYSPRVDLRLAAPAGEALPAFVEEVARCRRSTC